MYYILKACLIQSLKNFLAKLSANGPNNFANTFRLFEMGKVLNLKDSHAIKAKGVLVA